MRRVTGQGLVNYLFTNACLFYTQADQPKLINTIVESLEYKQFDKLQKHGVSEQAN